MRKSAKRRINIYLQIDANSINNYFNLHDPASLAKRHWGRNVEIPWMIPLQTPEATPY